MSKKVSEFLAGELEAVSVIALAKNQYATRLYNMYVDVKEFGATGMGTDDTTGITSAYTSVVDNATSGVIGFTMGNQNAYAYAAAEVGGSYVISEDMTIPAAIGVYIQPGVTIDVAAGKTLTIDGPMETLAVLSDVFTGSGTVVLNKASRLDGIDAHAADVTTNPHQVTKVLVGLSDVDDTADADKPISSAAQTALDLKAPLAGPTFSGIVTLPANQAVNGVTLTTAGSYQQFLRADGTYNHALAIYTQIADAGSYFTGTVVETALQEVGSSIADIQTSLSTSVVTEASTGRTLALSDKNKYIKCTSSSTTTITVPPNSSVAFDVGDEIAVTQYGAGPVTFAGGTGVTINSLNSNVDISGRYAVAMVKKIDTDEWQLIGSLS